MPRASQPRDAEKTRVAILASATTLFADKGYIGASISDIAEVVGVSKSTIYHYFASKEEILHSLIDAFGSEVANLNVAASKYKLDDKAILTEFAEITLKHKEILRLAPMIMPGAPKEIKDVILKQQKIMVRLLITGLPTKEKLMRAMLAIMGIIMSIAPPPGAPSGPLLKPDIKLIVKIALDTLGKN